MKNNTLIEKLSNIQVAYTDPILASAAKRLHAGEDAETVVVEEKSRREAQERAAAKKRDLERLELERVDLTEAAYVRKRAEIEARA